jgi:hypothetical protein
VKKWLPWYVPQSTDPAEVSSREEFVECLRRDLVSKRLPPPDPSGEIARTLALAAGRLVVEMAELESEALFYLGEAERLANRIRAAAQLGRERIKEMGA